MVRLYKLYSPVHFTNISSDGNSLESESKEHINKEWCMDGQAVGPTNTLSDT